MPQRIVFHEAGKVLVLTPAANQGLTIQQIALRDVPTGTPFKIVDTADIPTDRTMRSEWTVATTDLTDGVGL